MAIFTKVGIPLLTEYYIRCSTLWSSAKPIDLYHFRYNIDVRCRITPDMIQWFPPNKSVPFMAYKHFFKRIIQFCYTFSNESSTERKNSTASHRNSQENHYLCIQQAFCNIPAKMPYQSTPCI